MELLQDCFIAIFAAVGLATIVWVVADAFFAIGKRKLESAIAVLPVSGSADALEQTVCALTRTRCNGNRFEKILIADCGMDEESRAVALLLETQYAEVAVCAVEDAAQYIAKS